MAPTPSPVNEATAAGRLSQIHAHILKPATSNHPVTERLVPLVSDSLQYSKDKPQLLVLIFGWGGSTSASLQKYVSGYKHIDPSVVTFSFAGPYRNMFPSPLTTIAQREAGFASAVSAIESAEAGKVKIIIHALSNIGAYGAALFAKRFLLNTGSRLPVAVLILDSAPSRTSLLGKSFAISQSFAQIQLLAQFLLLLPLTVERLYTVATQQNEPTVWTYGVLNDPTIIDPGAKRCYIFSKEDKVTDWREVVTHAKEAENRKFKGDKEVRTEEFEGSRHVGHMKHNAVRYWKIVEESIASGS